MPYKNSEKRKEWGREYYKRNRDRMLVYGVKRRIINKSVVKYKSCARCCAFILVKFKRCSVCKEQVKKEGIRKECARISALRKLNKVKRKFLRVKEFSDKFCVVCGNKIGISKSPLVKYCIDCKKKVMRETNKRTMMSEKTRIRQKEYRIKNSEKYKMLAKSWRHSDSGAEKIRASKKNYYQKHKKEVNAKQNKLLKENIEKRLIHIMRCYVSKTIKKQNYLSRKCSKTKELLGCDGEYLKNYLESKFIEGMSWENYGAYDEHKRTWSIDHIVPCASFDLSKEEEQNKCFHYSNLQPMWWLDNAKKGNRF